MQTITIHHPDDWHCHLRDNQYLSRTVSDTCLFFKRAVIMPNLKPPVTTVIAIKKYLEHILTYIPSESQFTPLMTLYLTDNITESDIIAAAQSHNIIGCKLYPQGATTHSDLGVKTIDSIYPALALMQKHQLPLLIHGEIPGDVDIFDREALFIDKILAPLQRDFPELKITLEHISTRAAVQYVTEAPAHVGATITPQHLLLNRNDILAGGIKPHHYCLPILKRESDREALVAAATSGNPKFFLGTDSAPHTRQQKESACGCAGIYTAYHALPLYIEAFEKAGALDQLEQFSSINGPTFYGYPINTDKLTFVKKPWQVPESLSFGDEIVVPLYAGSTLAWQLKNE